MGLMQPVKPTVRVAANDLDITDKIMDRLRSLRLTDVSGLESDTLEIVLADHDPLNPIQKPAKGAELKVWLGYDDQVQDMGLYVFDEFERSGWPGVVTIRARAAIYDQTPKGKKDIQSQKSRSWADGTKLGAMVKKIAKEHGMEAAISAEMAKITLPHFDQSEESDLSFLLRVLKNYDAVVKPAEGRLVVSKRGAGVTVNGDPIPVVGFEPTDFSDFHMNSSERESPGTVITYWHSTRNSKRNEVKVGEGDPVKRIRHYFPTEEAAKQAAQSELNKRIRGQNKLTATLPGDPELMAEGMIEVTGFGLDDIDGEWLLARVEHEFDPGVGYRCRIEAERPLT